jgi:hypothetical protein
VTGARDLLRTLQYRGGKARRSTSKPFFLPSAGDEDIPANNKAGACRH